MKNKSLPKVYCFFLLMLMLSGCKVNKGGGIGNKTIEVCGVKLYNGLTYLSPEAKSFFRTENFTKALLVVQRHVEGEEKGTVDRARLTRFVERYIPYPKDDVLVMIDWEGPIMEALERGDLGDNTAFKSAASAYLEAYNLVKKLRPNAIVGFYRFPIREYHGRNKTWLARNRSLDTLFSQFDALFPSVYDFYVSRGSYKRRDVEYVEENIKEALAMGIRIDKPVYPFIWHRYHSSGGKTPNGLIEPGEFKEHVKAIVNTDVDGERVEGVVWWGSDYIKFVRDNKQFSTTAQRQKAYNPEGDQVLPEYYQLLKDAIKETCQEK